MQVGLDLERYQARTSGRCSARGFRARVHRDAERAYCDHAREPAAESCGRFAAKEAVGKALGTGVHFTWREIEVGPS